MENSRQKRAKPKSPKPKVFQMVQQKFAIAGITPSLSNQPYRFDGSISMGFLIVGLFMVCNFKYTFYEAKTFIEYTQTIYMGSLAALIIFALAIIILNVDKLFQFINDCGNLVRKTNAR